MEEFKGEKAKPPKGGGGAKLSPRYLKALYLKIRDDVKNNEDSAATLRSWLSIYLNSLKNKD